ncbi:hypothetical protein HanXRQr2_Chr09g0416911 [Helianthus annuus]|uniref:Uncharacterized protein n=1 Tax=Helianthus annuus TaxID=4232 RepID=A0A9K3IB09_HELAN|nr:hypothetical protein HanXRQr2_Chr09g0416911 [Helianthus annuus]
MELLVSVLVSADEEPKGGKQQQEQTTKPTEQQQTEVKQANLVHHSAGYIKTDSRRE